MSTTGAVIEAEGISAGYGAVPVLHSVSLRVEPGEVVALLGANGAGKTTTLLALSGELPLSAGEARVVGRSTRLPLHRLARNGLGFVPEERSVFTDLSLWDNLRAGRCDPNEALELFPELKPRLKVAGGQLSGGEQQMLTLARALARRPRALLADELSLGLAPLIVQRLLEAVQRAARERGTGVLLVEQHVRKVLHYADRVYVMSRGEVTMELSASDAHRRIGEIEDSYLASAVEARAPAAPTGNGSSAP
jgi:branched-chain amino acid transport system ATP-binding protein